METYKVGKCRCYGQLKWDSNISVIWYQDADEQERVFIWPQAGKTWEETYWQIRRHIRAHFPSGTITIVELVAC